MSVLGTTLKGPNRPRRSNSVTVKEGNLELLRERISETTCCHKTIWKKTKFWQNRNRSKKSTLKIVHHTLSQYRGMLYANCFFKSFQCFEQKSDVFLRVALFVDWMLSCLKFHFKLKIGGLRSSLRVCSSSFRMKILFKEIWN